MNNNSRTFCQQKILILKEYVTRGEEILSSIEDWELLAGILEKRDQLIIQLQNLEKNAQENNENMICSADEKSQVDNLLKLILDMDKNCIKLIQDEKDKTMNDLKNNQHNQKIVDYQINLTPNYGTFLDAKK
ncbi:flagellar protein FliT [Acetobacterium woodii]|uniref:Flagellar protein FliT n=1 Tax=Acetobacterium woodii (strain ATCC 29683 / DSM 1030 / JCM 2381 / KCTC 1655 / WB1) TaxID=931626 RepID=H6LDQ8_ACEWD|nr:flagellar protein FliT [Acetobacterium woodii]AFA49222.1 hypothetical protein Awo_c24650 [Acetobacterium woodii DSM 1030]